MPSALEALDGPLSFSSPGWQALQGLVRLVAAAPLQQGYAARLVSLRELTQLGVLPLVALQDAGIGVARLGAAT